MDFYQFLKRPQLSRLDSRSISEKLKIIFQLFGYVFLLEIAVMIPISFIIDFDSMSHAIEELSSTVDQLTVFLLAVIGAPVVEEFLFRYPLRNLILSRVVFFCFVLISSFFLFGWIDWKVAMVVAFSLCFFIGIQIKKKKQYIHFALIFYSSVILFALLHIFNFSTEEVLWWQGAFLVMPQFILGLLLGYVRVNFGMAYCILLHAVNNVIPFLLMVLADKSI